MAREDEPLQKQELSDTKSSDVESAADSTLDTANEAQADEQNGQCLSGTKLILSFPIVIASAHDPAALRVNERVHAITAFT